MIGSLLLSIGLAAGAGESPLAAGLSAAEAGRYADAVRLLTETEETRDSYQAQLALGQSLRHLDRPEQAQAAFARACALIRGSAATADSYDAQVALGLAEAGLGHNAEADAALSRAVALDPARAEAWTERGGLRFLNERYAEAVKDLRRSLALREDSYTRSLLAASCHLAGRSLEALDYWNVLNQPIVRSVELKGVEHTRGPLLRNEVGVTRGRLLRSSSVRTAQLRLGELGIFDRITLRPVVAPDGEADLEVALIERYGFAANAKEFLLTTTANAVSQQVQLKYSNLFGLGVNVGARYRWEARCPEATLALDWAHPFGLGANLRLQAARGRQRYALDGEPQRHMRGLDARLRRVLGPRTVGEVALRMMTRSFSASGDALSPGRFIGIEGAVESVLVDRGRHTLELRSRVLQTLGGCCSDVRFHRASLRLVYKVALGSMEDTESRDQSVLAVQGAWGLASRGTPADQDFAAGTSGDMEWPLRAHRQAEKSVVGTTALTRAISLANFEWRKRILKRTLGDLGIVIFWDVASIPGWATEPRRVGSGWYHDVGFGLRVRVARSTILRSDLGHSLVDGRTAVFVGLGHSF